MTQPSDSPYSPPSNVGLPPIVSPTRNTHQSAPRAAWLVAFMWLAYFLNYGDRQAVFAMFPVLRSELQFSESQLGLIGSVFLWVYGLGCPIAGLLSDRVSKRMMVVGSLAIWSLVTLATGLVNSIVMMLVLRAAMGISESMYMPAAVSLTANAHAAHQRSRAVSILTTAQICGSFIGAGFGGLMAGQGQWRMTFFIMGGIGLLYVLPYWLFLRSFDERPVDQRTSDDDAALNPSSLINAESIDESKSENARHANAFQYSARIESSPQDLSQDERPIVAPTYVVLCLVFPVFVFGLWMLYSWLANFLFEKFQLGIIRASLIASFTLQSSMLIGLLAGGGIADLLFKLFRSARLWLLVFSLVAAAPSLFFIGNSPWLPVTCVAIFTFGLVAGVFAGNIFPASFEVVSPQRRASAVGWLNFFGSMLSGFAPLVAGVWKQSIGLEGLLAGTAVAYVLAAILLSVGILRWYPRDSERAY